MSDEDDDCMDDCIINRVQRHMATDDDDPIDQSERLRDLYTGATKAQRKLLDDAFICLCGWSLDSLLQRRDL